MVRGPASAADSVGNGKAGGDVITGKPMLQHDPAAQETPPRRWRPSRSLTVVLVIGLLALAGIFIANAIPLNDYVLSPGVAQAVGPLISVPPAKGSASHGGILLTDVYESRISALQWPIYQLDPNVAVYPAAALFGPSVPAAQIQAQNLLEMVGSSELARVVALRRLGYQVPEHTGAVVLQVQPHTPASALGGLQPGDAITAVDGTALSGAPALTAALRRDHPGQRVVLSVTHVDGTSGPEALVLTSRPQHPSQAYAGVGVATEAYFSLPFKVGINSKGIGGPSAGLAFTLGIMNALGGGDLTAGQKVAATGTIALGGGVGAVGGVPQKTLAVRKAGATVFLVPAGANYTQALSKAGPHLHVVAVSSLSQALAALRSLGGHVPAGSQRPAAG
ncbi:MAG: PDZ domain-containing protein [Acidimicrobiales bacterium]